jgi:Flp pilus assembly protein TadB
VNAPTPEPSKGLSRNQLLLLTLLADVVGAVVIVGMLPIGWTTSLVVLAVYGAVVYFASQTLRRRAGG